MSCSQIASTEPASFCWRVRIRRGNGCPICDPSLSEKSVRSARARRSASIRATAEGIRCENFCSKVGRLQQVTNRLTALKEV
jgi:hypothetical protein